MKGLINIQNEDNEFFRYCIVTLKFGRQKLINNHKYLSIACKTT